MKTLLRVTVTISLFAFIFALLFACNEDELVSTQVVASIYEIPIGYFENNEFVFETPKQSILKSFKEMDAAKETGMTPLDAKVEVINNKPYLRIYGDDHSMSTFALVQNKNDNSRKLNTLVAFGGYCKSIACHTSGGCIPERGGCSNCVIGTKPNGQAEYGDCKKHQN